VALTDEAIEKIRQMIVTGRVGPGEKLPSETDLAAELGLSRSSLREAVRALSLVKVLEVRRGDGTYATSLEPSLLLETLGFIAGVHRDDTVLQFLEVRRALEPAATALAAMRMPAAALAGLAAVLGPAGANATATATEFVAAETEFHRRIAAGSGNPVLASLAGSMSMPTARTRLWRRVTEPGALERTLAEHRAIYGAIAGRDPDLARSWATAHIGGIESRLRAVLSG
jgi:GntR family transcriptional regulator, transcriptional repressor for pyruvate dehydrogenase complex